MPSWFVQSLDNCWSTAVSNVSLKGRLAGASLSSSCSNQGLDVCKLRRGAGPPLLSRRWVEVVSQRWNMVRILARVCTLGRSSTGSHGVRCYHTLTDVQRFGYLPYVEV